MSLMVPGTLLYSGYWEEALAPPGSRLTLCGAGPSGLGLGPAKGARVERQRYLAGRNATWSSKATPATGWNE